MSVALALPGRLYGHHQPGLRLAELALEQAGYTVVRAEWPADPDPEAVRRTAADALDGADLVLAKSLGTHAAPLVAERGLPAIWLTPLLRDESCVEAILRNPGRQLLLGGEDDPAWDPGVADAAAQAGALVITLPRADHGLEVPGDVLASAETLVTLARAVSEFLA